MPTSRLMFDGPASPSAQSVTPIAQVSVPSYTAPTEMSSRELCEARALPRGASSVARRFACFIRRMRS